MQAQRVDMFLMNNAKYLDTNRLSYVRERLLALDDSNWPIFATLQFKDPTSCLIVSILAGTFGVDRFLIGDTLLGIGKLLTLGGFGFWTVIDWFFIQGATREKNFQKIERYLY